MPEERILFLFLHTGGGHLSAARALEKRIGELSHGAKAFSLDPLESGGNFVATVLEDGYRISTAYARPIYIGIYESQKNNIVMKVTNFLMTARTEKKIRDFIVEKNITRVVLLHFLLIHPAARAVRELHAKGHPKIPCVTIALDPFTLPYVWTYKAPFPIVVFSERARKLAVENYKTPANLVSVMPIVLRDQFDHRIPDDELPELKKRLGFTPGKKLVLIAGGGEGFPRGLEYVTALLQAESDIEIAIVCGRDSLLKLNVELVSKIYPKKKVYTYGFVDFMYDLMSAADIIVAKAGPATVMEALLLGKPLVITQYIYGQEKGNMEYVVDNGLGFYLPHPSTMRKKIDELFLHPERYEAMKDAIERTDIHNGTDQICRYILSMK